MFTGISAKWIPFLIYTILQGFFANKYLDEKTCEALLLGNSIKISGRAAETLFLRSMVDEVNSLVGDLQIEHLKIYAVKDHAANRSFLLWNVLFAGMAQYQEQPQKTKTVFIHELAHAIFDAHFRVRVNGEEITVRQFRKRLMRNPTPELLKINHYIEAYNELFADMVTVLINGDATVIAQVHDFPSALELGLENDALDEAILNEVKWRPLDFTALINFRTWDKMFAELMANPETKYHKPHKFFAPLRGVLWRLYLREMPKDKIAAFMKSYLLAASEHLHSLAQYPDREESNLEMNRDFLRLIVRAQD